MDGGDILVLALTLAHLEILKAQAEQAYPQECCGFLLGTVERATEQGDRKVVVSIEPATNAWNDRVAKTVASELAAVLPDQPPDSSKRDRYWIDPREILTIQRTARDRQLTVIGIYHSHPDHPALPSECDRLLAWSGYTYIILSVQQGQVCESLAWVLDDTHQFQPDPLEFLSPEPLER